MMNILLTILYIHLYIFNDINGYDIVKTDSIISRSSFSSDVLWLKSGPFITMKPKSINMPTASIELYYIINSFIDSSTPWDAVSKIKLVEYTGISLVDQYIYADYNSSYYALKLTNQSTGSFEFEFVNSKCEVMVNADDSLLVIIPGIRTPIREERRRDMFECIFNGYSQSNQIYNLNMKYANGYYQIVKLNNVTHYDNKTNLNGLNVVTYKVLDTSSYYYSQREGLLFKFELDVTHVFIEADGAVKVNIQGTWNYIQHGSLTEIDAHVFCKETRNATVKSLGSRAAKPNEMIIFYEFKCPGNARDIMECRTLNRTDRFKYCFLEKEIEVTTLLCHENFQLQYNSDKSVSFLMNEKWGYLRYSYTNQEFGTVVCNQLGYSHNQAYSNSYMYSNETTFSMSNIKCFGRTQLKDCDSYIEINYGYKFQLILYCINQNGLVKLIDGEHNSGTVELGNNKVCADSFDRYSADLICKDLRYINAIRYSKISYTGKDVVGMTCQPSDVSLSQCKYNYIVKCSEVATIFCQNIQLVGSGMSDKGQVELIYQGQRGLLCDDGMNWHTAHVICHQLKFERAIIYRTGKGYGRYILDDLVCNASSYDDINKCHHNPWMSHNCGLNEVVELECQRKYNCTVEGLSGYNTYSATGLTDYQSDSFKSLVLIRAVQSLNYWCAGVLVDIYWILTSASCLSLHIGAINIHYDYRVYPIADQKTHIKYSDIKGDNNLVLLKIYNFTSQAHMCINNLNSNSNSSDLLQNSTIPLSQLNCSITIGQSENLTKWRPVRLIECHTLSPGLSQERLANYVCSDVDLTETLSGSPLMCNYNGVDMIFGLVNKDVKAARPVKTTFFTRLNRYVNWIQDIIQNN